MTTHAPESYLRNHFLLAIPGLHGGIFADSLTYICEHSGEGAMGIVVNHPLDLRVDEILDHLSLASETHAHNEPVLAGGPLKTDRGFVLHHADHHHWQASLKITSEIELTTSLDILDAIAHDQGPRTSLIALGYAGWAAGQLEQELERSAWVTVPADDHILFEVPHHRKLAAALDKLGVDFSRIAPYSGHA